MSTRHSTLRFTFGSYVRSHIRALCVLVVLVALLALIMHIAGINNDLSLLICALVVLSALIAYVAEYIHRRTYYQHLSALCCDDQQVRLLSSLVDDPAFAEGRIAHEALRAAVRAANDEVAGYRRQTEEYRTYVETWVHEAKTPLAAAHLAVENLRADNGVSPQELQRLRSIDDDLSRVEGFVEQALYYARSESVDRDFIVRRYSLRSMVTSAIKAQASALISAHITPQLSDSLDLEVFTDEKWFVFMLGQLLQNSARYAQKDPSIWFDARLVAKDTAEECVDLTVRDNGCGVSEADLARVFERGFTGDNGRAYSRSTGLGLWLVARLASKLGIGVSATSIQGEGFSITFSFSTNKMHYFE